MRSACLAALVIAVGCAHAQPPPEPEAKKEAPKPPPPAPPPPKPPAVTEAAKKVEPPQPVSVYFDYDKAELSPDARSALDGFYQKLQQVPGSTVRIEGNCDERGTAEYNIALGQRRADAARKYLENLGLDASRITSVSNGKEKPRATGHDEESWRQNRRDDVTPGGPQS